MHLIILDKSCSGRRSNCDEILQTAMFANHVFISLFFVSTFNLQLRDGEAIYYHGPHELSNSADWPEKISNFILNCCPYLPKETREKAMSRSERDFS